MSGQAPPPGGTTAPGVPSDQSMEDILASIRRILNEDEAPPVPESRALPPSGAATSAAAEPLLLTEDMIVTTQGDATPLPDPRPPEAAPAVAAVASEPLMAPAAAAAATASVGQLLRAVSSERGAAITRGGPTIEDVVREELRPLLKDWLDHHLPGIVERLVRAEIDRVVGRALS